MIRHAEPRDIKIIVKWLKSEPSLAPRTAQNVKDDLGHVLVAEMGFDSIVGTVYYEEYSNRMAELRSLYVVPQLRGIGIGSMLVKRAMKFKKVQQHVIVTTNNKEFFLHRGFSIEDKYLLTL